MLVTDCRLPLRGQSPASTPRVKGAYGVTM
jgi:hypothetical protein